jgi:glyoxylase-like metal-dependent hydrolase (beta-lactamase superfamily II)
MVEITRHIHSIDGIEEPFGIGNVPYLVEERPNDLTLIDTCFMSELPKLEAYLDSAGYRMGDIKRIILTHVHVDHTQAANEIKKKGGGRPKIYSHWADAAYLAHNPPYQGPPSNQTIQDILKRIGVTMEDVVKKFGSLEREAVIVDEQLQDGDLVESLKVIHTPGHTPGHISLYSEKQGIIFGADFLLKSVFGFDGLFISSGDSIDPMTAFISARRISQIKFDKLLLSHQDSPILEGGQKAVEKVTSAPAFFPI